MWQGEGTYGAVGAYWNGVFISVQNVSLMHDGVNWCLFMRRTESRFVAIS